MFSKLDVYVKLIVQVTHVEAENVFPGLMIVVLVKKQSE